MYPFLDSMATGESIDMSGDKDGFYNAMVKIGKLEGLDIFCINRVGKIDETAPTID